MFTIILQKAFNQWKPKAGFVEVQPTERYCIPSVIIYKRSTHIVVKETRKRIKKLGIMKAVFEIAFH